MKARLARIVAWLVTLGVLGYLFSTVPIRDVLGALQSSAAWTVPVLALLVVIIYLADAFAMWTTFGWFLARLPFREVLVVRGATYLWALVNYALGQGAIVYHVNRARGVPVARGAGAVLLVMGVNLLLLLLLASLGLALSPGVPEALKLVVAVSYAGLGAYIILIGLKPRRLASWPVFHLLLNIGIAGHVKAMGVRLPHIAALVVFTYTALRAFGVDVPLAEAALFLPIVYFLAVLPLSVQGIGPTQGAMVYFFTRYASGDNPRAAVLASSMTAQAIALCVQGLVGVVCMRNQLARDLARRSPAV